MTDGPLQERFPFLSPTTRQTKRKPTTPDTGCSFDPTALHTTTLASDSVGDLFSPLNRVNLYHRRLLASISPSPAKRPSRPVTGFHSRASLTAAIAILTVTLILLVGGWFIFGSDRPAKATLQDANMTAQGFSFEIFGRVQGVFFRKYTQEKGNELGLAGWIRNTHRASVEGEVAATSSDQNEESLLEMKEWLAKVGSPASQIERAEFTPLTDDRARQLLEEQDSFVVRKTTKRR